MVGERSDITHLDTVISVGVAQQLLKTRVIQQFFNEHLPCAMFGDPDALENMLAGQQQ